MSCDVDVFCVDCRETFDVSWNHGEKDVALLIKKRSSFRDLYELVGTRLFWSENGTVQALARFFMKHGGHRVVPRSEYGDIYNEDGEKTGEKINPW